MGVFDKLKGIRTKISLLGAGLLGILAHFGVIDPSLVETLVKLVAPFGIYWAVEHFEPKTPN